jgi:hypothetical protein
VWRGTTTLSWQRDTWAAGLSAYYTGSYQDSNATTTQATYLALGSPGYIGQTFTGGAWTYRYIVHDTLTYNTYASYRLASKNRWLNGTTVRVGVVNVFNTKPPLSSDARGYDPAVYNNLARGRAWSLQVTKEL